MKPAIDRPLFGNALYNAQSEQGTLTHADPALLSRTHKGRTLRDPVTRGIKSIVCLVAPNDVPDRDR